ncbi:hypothetical protein glysoja_012510 [Glycine soja]|nr:hypothetical protein glysoja_012510 [Glycine soja]
MKTLFKRLLRVAVEARKIGEGLKGESLLICSPLEAFVHSESDRKLTSITS